LEQRNKSRFGYKRRNWRSSNGGLKIYIRTASKCLLNYILLEQKTEKWQDEYRLNVLTILINTYLTEAFLKDENGKPLE
jgi:hypothetical protein